MLLKIGFIAAKIDAKGIVPPSPPKRLYGGYAIAVFGAALVKYPAPHRGHRLNLSPRMSYRISSGLRVRATG